MHLLIVWAMVRYGVEPKRTSVIPLGNGGRGSTGEGGGSSGSRQQNQAAKGTWSGLVERNCECEYCGSVLYILYK